MMLLQSKSPVPACTGPAAGCLPSDSVTTTVKNLTAPLTSLNQLQLNLKKMDDLVTTAALSLIRVPRGGTGGPAGVTAGGFRAVKLQDGLHILLQVTLTIDHGDHAVPSLLAGRPGRDDLHRHRVAFVGLQLGDEVGAGVSAGASGVDQGPGILVQTLNGVGVVVGLRGHPGAGDGGGALRATVEAVDSLRLCSKNTQVLMQY